MAEQLSERQQSAAERIEEDEGLAGDLTDAPARALIDWARKRAVAIAGDAALSDEQVHEHVSILRRVAQAVASSGATDAPALLAKANAALGAAVPMAIAPTNPPEPPPEPAPVPPEPAPPVPEPTPPMPPEPEQPEEPEPAAPPQPTPQEDPLPAEPPDEQPAPPHPEAPTSLGLPAPPLLQMVSRAGTRGKRGAAPVGKRNTRRAKRRR